MKFTSKFLLFDYELSKIVPDKQLELSRIIYSWIKWVLWNAGNTNFATIYKYDLGALLFE